MNTYSKTLIIIATLAIIALIVYFIIHNSNKNNKSNKSNSDTTSALLKYNSYDQNAISDLALAVKSGSTGTEFDNTSTGSNIAYCSKTSDFNLFGYETKIHIRIGEFLKTWSATAHASISKILDSKLSNWGTSTSTTTVTVFSPKNWTGTTSTSSSMAGTTTTTTSTTTIVDVLDLPSTTTTTTTTSSGGKTTTTTTTGTIKLNDNGGTCSTTTTSASGLTITTTTTSTTFNNLISTDNLWAAFFTSTSTSTSGGVTTTTTTSAHVLAVKEAGLWKGSLSINSASASSAGTHTSSYCYQFTLPGMMNPGNHLHTIWSLIACAWNGLLGLSGNLLHLLNVITEDVKC